MSGQKGVLFDLDGVIVDTESKYSVFWNEIDGIYPTGAANFSTKIKGSNLQSILNTYFDSDVHANIVKRLDDFQHNMKYEYFAGAKEFIEELKSRDIPTCLVTSSDKKKMQSLYAQHPEFHSLFNAIITGEMVSKTKPDPEGYLCGAKQIGCDIADCYVFEDSKNGVKAGRNSGAKVIGVATTLSADEIKPFCDYVITGLGEFTVEEMLNI